MNRSRLLFALAIILIVVVGIFILVPDHDGQALRLNVGSEIPVPQGYTFVDASAHGRFTNMVTVYCRNDETGRIYVCTDNKVGKEIVLPEGYSFAGASAYGDLIGFVTYYCRENTTGRVFVCKPE